MTKRIFRVCAPLLFGVAGFLMLAGASVADVSTPTSTHWSFQPVRRVQPPAVDDNGWCTNGIDRFIVDSLQHQGLHPAPAASRPVFIRRLYLIVLGVPPSTAEIDDFQNDTHADPYEKLVDRVLASPRYGERWASHWLDLVKFAETTGFETNVPRPNAWPYRDWVIDAFNRDEPYTDFILDQLAGDARDANAATGFLVAGPDDRVKSPDIVLTSMQRHDELRDIVNTTSTAFLGLTVACATCHNHKFDPITQTDFYRFKAVFAGVHHGDRPLRTENSTPQEIANAALLRQRLDHVRAAIECFEPLAMPNAPSGKWRRSAVNPKRNIERFAPVSARYVRFTILGTNGAEPCIDEMEIFTAGEKPRNVALAKDGAVATASGCYKNNPRHKIEHINDGQFGNDHSWISDEKGRGWIQIQLPAESTIDRIVWGRDLLGRYSDRVPILYHIEVATEPGKWQVVADSDDRAVFGSKNPSLSTVHLSAEEVLALEKLQSERHELEGKLSQSAAPMVYAGIFQPPPPIHRLYRGDPLAEKEEVPPGSIEALGRPLKLATDTPDRDRRLALARWIASDENPLTARVMVNRIWQHTFGEGIVSTPSDFGKMGTPPSSPELLDYLASQFMEHGWSVKQLHRQLLLSATFRQSSKPVAEGLKIDASDRLLWRFPPRRLEAEAIHDSVLAVSGKLDLQMGGPGYSAFMPNTNYVRVYDPKENFGPEDWRRMIYETKVRMQIDATFGAFDCPDAGQVAPKRTRSTTPLQVFNLMNGNFVLQQAGFFAERLQKEAGRAPADQARLAFRIAFGREVADDELAASVRFIAAQGLPLFCRAMYNANEFVFVN